MKVIIITLIALVASIGASAQTEKGGTELSAAARDTLPMQPDHQLMMDSLTSRQKAMGDAYQHEHPMTDYRAMSYTAPTIYAARPFRLWNHANIAVNGMTYQMPGLMDVATGTLSLHQDFGRLHLSASAIANKYWLPMQGNLYTQYGYGGTIGYDLSEAITLHAFGYYYAGNPIVAPAFSPYFNTTAFGGYADVRFSERFGANMGVRRYVNPMSGRWTNEPIVTPYFKVGKTTIGLPVGNILKALVWGDHDNPTRFRPLPPPKQR